jgi:hypothetical protein
MTLAILLGRDLLSWYPAVPPDQHQYIAQRMLYVLGTNTDVPVVQVLVTGVILQIAARRGKRGPLPPRC